MLHGGLAFVDAANGGHAGSLVQKARQPVQPIGRAYRVNLHAAICLIPHPTSQSQIDGVFLNKPAKAHPLYVA